MTAETIYWIFSTIPQVIAALTGLSLTAITFLFSNLNYEIQKDKTLTEIIGNVEKKIHTDTTRLILWSLAAIAADILVLLNSDTLSHFLTNSASWPVYGIFLLWIGIIVLACLNIVPFLSLYYLLHRILDPDFKTSVIKSMARDENESQTEIRTAEPMEFMEYFRQFEKKIRILYKNLYFGAKESILTLSKIMRNEKIVTNDEYDLIVKMIKMRNIFIHGGDIEKVDYYYIDILEHVTTKIDLEIAERIKDAELSPRDRIFTNWINNNVEDLTEAYELIQAIRFKDRYGQFYAVEDNGVLYVHSENGPVLRLNSDDAKRKFIVLLDQKFGIGDLGVEDSYHFNRNDEKDD